MQRHLGNLRDYLVDRAVRRGLWRGSHEYVRFAVVSSYRSGSNWFLSLLRGHPGVVCHSEVFFPKRIYWGNAAYALREDDPRLLRQRGESPAEFLEEAVFRPYAPRVRAVGFKLMYTHAEKEHLFPGLRAHLIEDPSLRFIHLRRRNLLRMFVSLRVAGRTGAMSSTSKSDARRRLDAVPAIEFTVGECREHFERITAFWRKWEERAGLTLDYEDLSRDPQGTVGAAFDFLGLPRREVESPLVKQTTRELSALVANYEEIEAAFRDTEWGRFFED